MQHAGHFAVERDAAGDAQIAASRFAQDQAREVKRRLLEPLLHRERDVAVALRDLLGRAARLPKSVDDLVAEEPAVATTAVEDAVGIQSDAVGREPQETFDERAQRRIGPAVRRQPHQLDLTFIRIPAEILRHRAVEPSERVRQSQMTAADEASDP